jgi:hypothetical protein
MYISSTLYATIAVIVGFIGLIVVGYNVEKDDMDAEVCIPIAMVAMAAGLAWPIVIGGACLLGIGYVPISIGKFISKYKKKANFKKELKETYESPIDKIKKR